MGHPVVRVGIAVLVVVIVLIGLKLFRLAPDDVFTPHADAHVDMPFGSFSIGSGRDTWFRPLLLVHVLSVPAMWCLCSRLGYSSWFSLAMLVPLANILLLYFLAFAEWPLGPRSAGAAVDTETAAPNVVQGAKKMEDSRPSSGPERSAGVIHENPS
jgi:hypothetical protein